MAKRRSEDEEPIFLACRMNSSNHAVVTLHAPWPASLGRYSMEAARAVRSAPANVSSVTFTVPEAQQNSLLSLPNFKVAINAADAATYYEARASADIVEGRRLQDRPRPGRFNAGPPLEPPLSGSMGGYYTCAYSLNPNLSTLRPPRVRVHACGGRILLAPPPPTPPSALTTVSLTL